MAQQFELACAPSESPTIRCPADVRLGTVPARRKQQAADSSIHRQAMEQTEEARRRYFAACTESNKVSTQRKQITADEALKLVCFGQLPDGARWAAFQTKSVLVSVVACLLACLQRNHIWADICRHTACQPHKCAAIVLSLKSAGSE